MKNTSCRALAVFPMTVLALSLSACGGDDNAVAGSGGNNNPPPAPVVPSLAFTAPGSTYDLANYFQTGRYTLPTDADPANMLASEASAVTYNKDTDSLFVVGDGGTSVVQVSKQGALIDSMALAADPSKPQGTYFYDTEGIAWVGGSTFVLVEERFRQVDQFTYVPGTTLGGSGAKTVKLGTTIGNIGIEGITYDPMTNGFIAVKETGPLGIFQTTIDFAAGKASNGSPTTDNAVNLFDPAKTGLSTHNDVFALSNVLQSSAPDYDNLIVISAPDGRIVKVDRAGNVKSSLAINSAAQDEGVTMDTKGNIYAVGEQGGGPGRPQLVVYSPTVDKNTVGTGSNFYLTFPNDVTIGSGEITVSDGKGDVRKIAVSDKAQVTVAGKLVTVNPSSDLAVGTRYSITYTAGAFKTASSEVPALSDTAALSFTTEGTPDKTPPKLVATSPSDDSVNVVVGAPILLTFNEAMRAGSGNIVIAGAGDTRTIAVTDKTQVTFSGSTVSIKPTADLQSSVSYNVQFPAGALQDLSGNAFEGITTATALNFGTAVPVAAPPKLLITEVNSNATGGDFFELYNYGTAAVDLSGWKWGDDKASFTDKDIATFPANTIIQPGARLVVVNTTKVADFDTAWGLSNTAPVIAIGGPGLGGGDLVVVYDAGGKVVVAFNYEGGTFTASDGTKIPPSVASAGVTVNMPKHAGIAFGGAAASTSAVWDGVSTSAPTYKAAAVGVLGGFAQPGDSSAIGSPGN